MHRPQSTNIILPNHIEFPQLFSFFRIHRLIVCHPFLNYHFLCFELRPLNLEIQKNIKTVHFNWNKVHRSLVLHIIIIIMIKENWIKGLLWRKNLLDINIESTATKLFESYHVPFYSTSNRENSLIKTLVLRWNIVRYSFCQSSTTDISECSSLMFKFEMIIIILILSSTNMRLDMRKVFFLHISSCEIEFFHRYRIFTFALSLSLAHESTWTGELIDKLWRDPVTSIQLSLLWIHICNRGMSKV